MKEHILSSKPKVAISKVSDVNSAESIERAVRESVAASCDFDAICKGKHVVF